MKLSTCFIDANLKRYFETLNRNNFSTLVLVKNNETGNYNMKVSGDIDMSDVLSFLSNRSLDVNHDIPRLTLPLSSLVNNPVLVNNSFSNLLKYFLAKGQKLGQVNNIGMFSLS